MTELVAARLGLRFSPERRDDLERGLAAAAAELGLESTAKYVDLLLSSPLTTVELQVLATHLTIGETYFFRDPRVLEVLRDHVLAELIRSRRGREQRLRVWSAASSTGEEPYSIAILLHQLLPDLRNWNVTITATDVNIRSLSRAAAGVYRPWSFRNAPAGLKERYFDVTPDGSYAICSTIKKLVTFSYLNLVEDAYPSLLNETNAMDLILCRNVLMYFTPAQIDKVVGSLHRALVDGGRLVVSPSEASQAIFQAFDTKNYPGVVVYAKPGGGSAKSAVMPGHAVQGRHRPLKRLSPPSIAPGVQGVATALGQEPPEEHAGEKRTPYVLANTLYTEGRYAAAAEMLTTAVAERQPTSEEFSLLAHALANAGRLGEALECADRWIEADKSNAASHHLRATVLLELDNALEASVSLQRAIYLRPDFVVAHFALGNIARAQQRPQEADRHFGAALRALRRCEPDAVVAESDGLTAARLTQIITAMVALEDAT